MKAWLEDFIRTSMRMFARLRRTGWATLSPVMTEIFVLSDERVTPMSVAPSGRSDFCFGQERWPGNIKELANLHFPGSIAHDPLCVNSNRSFGILIKPDRAEVDAVRE